MNEELKAIAQQLNDISIDDVISSIDPTAAATRKREGSNAFKYSLTSGDAVKITEGHLFYFFQRQKGNRGALWFMQELEGMTFKEAKSFLIEGWRPDLKDGITPQEKNKALDTIERNRRNSENHAKLIARQKYERPEDAQPIKLPECSETHVPETVEFLKGRGLTEQLAKQLIESRTFYPSIVWMKSEKEGKKPMKFLNMISPVTRFSDNKPVGTSNRALRSNRKINAGDKQTGAFQLGVNLDKAESVVFTESPMEALSYALVKKVNLDKNLILGVSGKDAPHWLVAHIAKSGKACVTAYNNDIAGRTGAKSIADTVEKFGGKYVNDTPSGGEIMIALKQDDPHHMEAIDEIESSHPKTPQTITEESKLSTLRVYNTEETCRSVAIIKKREQRRTNIQMKKARESGATPAHLEKMGEDFKRDKIDISFICSDWNDLMRGGMGKKFGFREPLNNHEQMLKDHTQIYPTPAKEAEVADKGDNEIAI